MERAKARLTDRVLETDLKCIAVNGQAITLPEFNF